MLGWFFLANLKLVIIGVYVSNVVSFTKFGIDVVDAVLTLTSICDKSFKFKKTRTI